MGAHAAATSLAPEILRPVGGAAHRGACFSTPCLFAAYCGVKTTALFSVAEGSVTVTKPAAAPAGTVAVR